MWRREGFFYVARLQWVSGVHRGTVEKRLDCISYHLIKWIHGEEALRDIAMRVKVK